ncbi:MAG: putative rane protein, partial [Aeromicrobium sp.]|nr:putative rane protein [Aeromicrobium sp.]
MSCEFEHYDGAYVLGALSPDERHAFENHLTECDDCARGVRELAGLPGLLARVDPRVVEDPPIDVPVPPTLLPALVHEVRRSRRRRVYLAVGAAAATIVIAAGTTVLITSNNGSDTPVAVPTSSATATSAPMSPVGSGPLKASLGFTSVAWGTKIDLSCSYD